MNEKIEFNAFVTGKDFDSYDIRQNNTIRQVFTSTVSAKYSSEEWQEYDDAKERCKNDWREWELEKRRHPKFEQIARDYKAALDAFDRHCKAHENNKKQ